MRACFLSLYKKLKREITNFFTRPAVRNGFQKSVGSFSAREGGGNVEVIKTIYCVSSSGVHSDWLKLDCYEREKFTDLVRKNLFFFLKKYFKKGGEQQQKQKTSGDKDFLL